MPFPTRLTSALFLLLLLLSASIDPSSSATDTLLTGDTLTGNATLVSASDTFEFGFFPAANSTDRVYLGVWYRNITPRTVIWVANRDDPFANSSMQITISADGNLVVLESGSKTAWSTLLAPVYGSNATVTIRENGNLVIQNNQGTRTWQSFDHPTDTLLSGMMISFNGATGTGTRFVSWRTADDPSTGNYTLELDERGANQLVMLDRAGGIRWRTGLWTANGFNGVDRMQPLYQYGFQLNADPEQNSKMNLAFTFMNNTKIRFVLLPNGTETTYVYENGEWNNIWQQPVTECEFYNHCGKNAVCQSVEPTCACLFGYEPEAASEWANGNWTRGCVRRIPLQGQGNQSLVSGEAADGFFHMEWIKFPDVARSDSSATDAAGCRENCLVNKSCTAYAYLDIDGCFRWTGDLLDMFTFADESNGGELFIRLAASELDFGKNHTKEKILIGVLVPSGAILLLACFSLWWKCKPRIKGMRKKERVESMVGKTGTSGEQREHTMTIFSDVDDYQSERKTFELPMFSFEVIETATDFFDEENKLGKGGFGNVYKGKLPSGEEIAVKRLSKNSGQGQEEFKNEMTLIAKLQHVNLVRLLGCCVHGEERILIYEYMFNKSLDVFIFDPEKQPLLDWRTRFNIIEGIARGLVYLHRDSRLRIVHRDLKASNILLDDNMNPKISDFGMARIFGSNQNHDSTNHVVGTFGYMSPEYAMEGLFSDKSDVYSFGVLLLEIVTGKKNSRYGSEDYQNLLGYMWHMSEEGRGIELVDPSILKSCSTDEVLRCIHIALLCVQDRAKDRPTMSSVVKMLETEVKLPTPRQPTFACITGSPTRAVMDGSSTNELTITNMEGR